MKSFKTILFSTLMATSTLTFANNPTDEANTQSSPTTEQVQSQSITQGNLINLNTATASQLQSNLIGIGAKKAEAIVQYREKIGGFSSIEQLQDVQGIGKATLEKNRERLTL